MWRIAMAWVWLLLAVPVARADPASDCSQHQDTERRIRGCGEFIQQNPPPPGPVQGLPQPWPCLLEEGQHDSAIRDYNKAIELNAGVLSLFYDRGTLLLIKKQYDRAIADYDKALALNPRDDNSLFQRGAAYADKGQYDRAIADFTKALEINPRSARTFFNRGSSHLKSKQADKALSDYSKAIELDPKLAVAHANRGLAYELIGRNQEAIADFKKSLVLDPRLKIGEEGLKRIEAAAVPSDPAAADFCGKAKEPKKCLSTRALLQQLKTDAKAARWSSDVDFEYAQGDDELNTLFKFMLESIPSRAPQQKR